MTSAEKGVFQKAKEVPQCYGCDDSINLVFDCPIKRDKMASAEKRYPKMPKRFISATGAMSRKSCV
jgi:hypothetical protein